MLYSTALLALVASASVAIAAPDGCKEDFDGQFTFTVQNVTSAPASKFKRQSSSATALCPEKPVVRLSGSVITDQSGSVGEIVANEQLQFDPGPQPGFKAASGFSVCQNNTLALESTIFYQCLSGDFYNLYDKSLGKQCNEVYIIIEPCQLKAGQSLSGAPASATGSAVSTMPLESMMPAQTSSSAASAPASTSATPSSTLTSAVVASTGTGSPAPKSNGTVSTASSPSGSNAPEAFKGAASTVAIGQALVVLAAGVVGFALL